MGFSLCSCAVPSVTLSRVAVRVAVYCSVLQCVAVHVAVHIAVHVVLATLVTPSRAPPPILSEAETQKKTLRLCGAGCRSGGDECDDASFSRTGRATGSTARSAVQCNEGTAHEGAAHTQTHTHTHIYIHTYIRYTYTHIHTHTHTYIHIHGYARTHTHAWAGTKRVCGFYVSYQSVCVYVL